VQSLNTIVVLLISFWLITQVAAINISTKNLKFIYVIALFCFLSYFYVLVNHGEFAVVLVTHMHYLMFFTIAQYYFLIQNRTKEFLLFALLAFLTKYEALLFTLIGLCSYQYIFKPNVKTTLIILLKYTVIILPYILLMTLIGLIRGDYGVYLESFFVERFARIDYLGVLNWIFSTNSEDVWMDFSLKMTMKFLVQAFTASLGLLIIIFWPVKDKISRYFQLTSLIFFFIICMSRVKRVHYISPLVLTSVIVAIRTYLIYYAKLKPKYQINNECTAS